MPYQYSKYHEKNARKAVMHHIGNDEELKSSSRYRLNDLSSYLKHTLFSDNRSMVPL